MSESHSYYYVRACVCVIVYSAQQEAQRATFVVERAKQERQEKVVRAEGESQAAKMISTKYMYINQHNVYKHVDLF